MFHYQHPKFKVVFHLPSWYVGIPKAGRGFVFERQDYVYVRKSIIKDRVIVFCPKLKKVMLAPVDELRKQVEIKRRNVRVEYQPQIERQFQVAIAVGGYQP